MELNTTASEKLDLTGIECKLEKLNGNDYDAAEKTCRMDGDTTPDLTFSKNFQAVLLATALDVPVFKVKELPIRDYVTATSRVSNFLLGDLVKERAKAQQTTTAKSQ